MQLGSDDRRAKAQKNAEPPPVDRTEGGRCALEGTRTPNLLIRSQMLYPLSYERIAVWLTPTVRASASKRQNEKAFPSGGFDHTPTNRLPPGKSTSRILDARL